METKTCPYCRTVNEGHAIVCVNCSATIGVAPGPTQEAPAAADDGGFMPPPPPAPAAAGAPPGVAVPTVQGAPAPKRSNTMLLLAVAAAALIVGAGVVMFLLRGGGGGLPAELNGHQRADSEIARQLEDMFDSFEVAGVSFEVGLYGDGAQPAAMLMLIEGLPGEVTDVPSSVFFESFATSFAQQSGLGGLDFGDPVTASSGGADFICVDAPAEALGGAGLGGAFGAGQGGSFCVFKGETVGMVLLFDGTGASTAMVAAQAAYGEIA
jgi:hypothetical protein